MTLVKLLLMLSAVTMALVATGTRSGWGVPFALLILTLIVLVGEIEKRMPR